jgi:WD40 repeat protein
VCLWDVATGKETIWRGHTGDVQGLAFSPAAPLLATCGEDGTIRLWDRDASASGVRTFGPGPFGGAVRAVAFTPDGRYLATANANGTVYLLRVTVKSPPTPGTTRTSLEPKRPQPSSPTVASFKAVPVCESPVRSRAIPGDFER